MGLCSPNGLFFATDEKLTSHTIEDKSKLLKSRMTYDSASSERSPLTPWPSELRSIIEGHKFIPLSNRELCFPRFSYILRSSQISLSQALVSCNLFTYFSTFSPQNPLFIPPIR
jgi:hypothetical protein